MNTNNNNNNDNNNAKALAALLMTKEELGKRGEELREQGDGINEKVENVMLSSSEFGTKLYKSKKMSNGEYNEMVGYKDNSNDINESARN
jgi:hypothetical protein